MKDVYGYFKLFSFCASSNFKFFNFYIEIFGKVFSYINEKKIEEINLDLNKNKIFFLNISQIIYGLEDTCYHFPLMINDSLLTLFEFIPILMKFLNDFNLLHIYSYCNIEEILMETDEKIYEELDSLSRGYTYKSGGLLLSITNIVFFLLGSSLKNEEMALKLLKFIDQLIFNKSKFQNFEKTLNNFNGNLVYEKIRKSTIFQEKKIQ